MAKKRDTDLMAQLRESGLRKKVARSITDSAGQARKGKTPKLVTDTVSSLRKAATELENRVTGPDRRAAAKKGAATRKRKAAARRASARKGARTRARAA